MSKETTDNGTGAAARQHYSSAIGKRDAHIRNYYWCCLCERYTPAYPLPDGKGCEHERKEPDEIVLVAVFPDSTSPHKEE